MYNTCSTGTVQVQYMVHRYNTVTLYVLQIRYRYSTDAVGAIQAAATCSFPHFHRVNHVHHLVHHVHHNVNHVHLLVHHVHHVQAAVRDREQ